MAGDSRAYVAIEGGGGGYGDGIVKVQDTASASSCADTCTAASLCTQSCTLREQTCSGGSYVTPSSSYYSADNNSYDTYGTTYQNYSSSALASATGDKDTQNDTLVCSSTGAEATSTKTCGYIGLCAPPTSSTVVGTKTGLFALSCSVNTGFTAKGVSTDSATKKNKWFGFDKEIKSGSKASKTEYSLRQKFGIAATLFKTRLEIFRLDSDAGQKVADASVSGSTNWSKLYQLGSILSSNNPAAKTWSDTSPTDAEMDAFAKPDLPQVSDNKKRKTWNFPVVRAMVGPVMVRVDMFVQAGFDLPFVFKLLKDTAAKYVGAYVRGTFKGYIHGGAKATASVIVASIAIKGTVNLITAALSGNLGFYGIHPTTGRFSAAHLRTYVGADFDLTTLDGTVKLIIRLLWKRWKIKLADWKGLHWKWIIGGQYHAKCENLDTSTPTVVTWLGNDFVNDITGGGAACLLQTCESLGKTCGSWANGCGGTLTCGSACATSGGGGGGGGGGSGSYYY